MKITSNKIESYIKNIDKEKIAGCLVYGAESTITRFRFDMIAKKIAPDLTDPFLVVNLSSDKIKEDKAILADEFYSIAMLGGRRLIIIKDCDIHTLSALKILLADPSYGRKSDNFILMLGGDLDKGSGLRKLVEENQFLMAIPCYEESSESVRIYIDEALKINNIKTDKEVVNLMVKNFAKDRNLMQNEIAKIKTYLGSENELSLELFLKLVPQKSDEKLYDFVINFANKNYEECLLRAEKAFENSDESIMLTRNLINYYTKLYNAKLQLEAENKSIDEVAKSAQIFFKNENDFKKHLQNLSLKFITKALQSFENLEINLKKGNMPSRLVFLSYIKGYIVKKSRR